MLQNRLNISKSLISKVLHESIKRFLIEEVSSDTLIIYHRVDWDGFTSGAIALMENPSADLLGWNYGDPLPDVSGYNKVILLDLTINERGDFSWMEENADKLVWIDHHANMFNSFNVGNISGVRKDGIGACVLAWEYFFGGEIPLHIRLCATYDIFRKDGYYCDWEDAWAYQLALATIKVPRGGIDSSHIGVNYAMEFIKESPQETEERIEYGYSLEEERANHEVELFNKAEFVDRDGIKICKLISGKGTPAHNIKTNSDNHTADVFILRSPNPIDSEGHYKIAIRVPERSNVDASQIARQYGGNGHIKAAGCVMTLDEFNSI